MPTFSFEGFPSGGPVALSATQLGEVATGSVSSWGVVAGGTISVEVETAAVVTAPAQIWGRVSGLSGFAADETSNSNYDPSFHELRWIMRVQKSDGLGGWDDNPLPDWTAPNNILDEWNDPNRRFTKRAKFVLPDPGSYRIVTQAVDKDGVFSMEIESETIVVRDPNLIYQNSRTIVYSEDQNEDWAEAPANSVKVTSAAALLAALDAAGPRRILFKRDGDFTLTSIGGGNNYFTHIGAWGSGTNRPIVRPDTSITKPIFWISDNSTPDAQWTVADIDFRCDWNPATEKGEKKNAVAASKMPNGSTVTYHNCDFIGFNGVDFGTDGNANPTRSISVAVSNCKIEGFSNYGSFTSGNLAGTLAFLGTRIASADNALHGGRKETISNHHGPIRVAHCLDVEFTGCDFFSNSDWSGSIQPCLRLLISGDSEERGATYTVNRCSLEGGATMVSSGQLGKSTSGNWLFDQILMIGNANVKVGFSMYFSGATFRNILFWYPDVQRAPSNDDLRNFIEIGSAAPSADYANGDIAVYNCTLYSALSSANDLPSPFEFIKNTAGVLTVHDENNIVHRPDGTTADAANAPINVTASFAEIEPRYKGYRANYAPVSVDNSSTVPNGGTITIPYSSILRQDRIGEGPGLAADQAFMLALTGNDHHVGNGEYTWYLASDGNISISFDATEVVITNTSGQDWNPPGAQGRFVKFDMVENIDSDLPIQTQFGSPTTFPKPLPEVGSNRESASGRIAQTDLTGATRQGFFDLDELRVIEGSPIGGAIDELG